LHESDVANLFNLAAGPVENAPEHKALEAEQGFGYRSVLGKILFAYVLCRPNIGYAVTTLAKFCTAPNILHHKSIKHLAICLRQTQDCGIVHWRSEPVASLPKVPYVPRKVDDSLPVIPPPAHLHQLITHVDATHANELRQRRSTTGYECCLAGGVVAYCSCTQSICAQSSREAELIAANAAAKVTKCLRFILHKLGCTQTEHAPIYEDNDSVIKIINHSRPTDRSRHVEIRHFALQHQRLTKDIILIHLPGVVNPADMLTKALGWVLHCCHAPDLMGHYCMAILASNVSWFCFQLLLPPRRRELVLLNIFLRRFMLLCFEIALAGPFFPALMCSVFRIRGGCQRASCATYSQDSYTFHHERLSTDEAWLWTMQQH